LPLRTLVGTPRVHEPVIMNAKPSGLGKSFEEAYGESMEEYLNGCINGVKTW